MNKLHLSKIDDFGGIDADNDPLLIDCFEVHPAFEELKSHKKFCVIGRKGSGKTAIFKKILADAEMDRDCVAIGHTFNEYPWEYHDLMTSKGTPEESCYVNSWKYLCYISLSKMILESMKDVGVLNATNDDLNLLKIFVTDAYGSISPDISSVFSPSTKLKFSASGGISLGFLKAKGGVKQIDMSNLPTHFHEINKILREAIINLLSDNKNYHLLFDQLDHGFTTTNSQYYNRLIGLLMAARDINIYAKEKNKSLTIGVFLRDDIFEMLEFEDKTKLIKGNTSYVYWDYGKGAISLMGLMERRFRLTLGHNEINWDDVFDETQQMSGKQTKYNYILSRTFLRPRDIITYCNEVLEEYKQNPSGVKFSNENVRKAAVEYSDYLHDEMSDEIFKHIPRYKLYFEVIEELEALDFEFKSFEAAWKKHGELSSDPEENPLKALKMLHEFSVVGYRLTGGGAGGSRYVWRYLEPRSRLKANMTQFKVHPGFKDAFSLKLFRRNRRSNKKLKA